MITDKIAICALVTLSLLAGTINLVVVLSGTGDFWNVFFVVVNFAFAAYILSVDR